MLIKHSRIWEWNAATKKSKHMRYDTPTTPSIPQHPYILSFMKAVTLQRQTWQTKSINLPTNQSPVHQSNPPTHHSTNQSMYWSNQSTDKLIHRSWIKFTNTSFDQSVNVLIKPTSHWIYQSSLPVNQSNQSIIQSAISQSNNQLIYWPKQSVS